MHRHFKNESARENRLQSRRNIMQVVPKERRRVWCQTPSMRVTSYSCLPTTVWGKTQGKTTSIMKEKVLNTTVYNNFLPQQAALQLNAKQSQESFRVKESKENGKKKDGAALG